MTYEFLKGHGTENDFVILPDPDGSVHGPLSPERVRALCDRRAGIGADGAIRVIRSADLIAIDASVPAEGLEAAEWFMDYRNSDGSISEMCGNGVRVFARFLLDELGVFPDEPIPVGTRDGVKWVSLCEPEAEDDESVVEDLFSVDMGQPVLHGETKVAVADLSWPATHVELGNPHAVAILETLDEAGDLVHEPAYDVVEYPQGVNVEFVVRRGEGHIAMRVHERGSGETRSCGTGACAAMVAVAVADDRGPGTTYDVDVPGGRLTVAWTPEGRITLTGPAVLVARGQTDL